MEQQFNFTGATTGEPAQVASVRLPRFCAGCDGLIPSARLSLKPTALYCARCQEVRGDVPRYHSEPLQSATGATPIFSNEEEHESTHATIHSSGLAEVMEREPEHESGTARNTGLHVISKEGLESWTERGKSN
jgi:hypothetical protein